MRIDYSTSSFTTTNRTQHIYIELLLATSKLVRQHHPSHNRVSLTCACLIRGTAATDRLLRFLVYSIFFWRGIIRPRVCYYVRVRACIYDTYYVELFITTQDDCDHFLVVSRLIVLYFVPTYEGGRVSSNYLEAARS
jgi:hypothetical protein